MATTARQKVQWGIAILVVLLYALIPVAWMVSLSLKPGKDLGDKKFFSGFNFDNYSSIFKNDDFTRALINSLGIAAISTFIAIVLAAMVVVWTSCSVASIAVDSFFHLSSPFPLVLLSAYIAGAIPSLWRALAGLVLLLAALVIVNLTFGESVLGDYLFPGGFVVAMWSGSRALRNRALLAA